MALPIKTVELPFESGLDQKADTLWLDAGQSNQALNLVKKKKRSLQKRQGLQALTTNWQNVLPLTATNGASSAGTFTSGRRLSALRGTPVLFGQASGTLAQQQIVARLRDQIGAASLWLANDLTPSAYLAPWEIVGPGFNITGECDCAVANGVELYVILKLGVAGLAGKGIFVLLRDAATGALLVGPTQLGTSTNVLRPQVIVTAGRYFVIAWNDYAANDIRAQVIDSTTLLSVAAARINVTAGDSGVGTPFDVVTIVGDSANFALLYNSFTGGANHIKAVVCAGATLAILRSANIDGADALYTADGLPGITGCAVYADNGLNELAVTYAWQNGGGVTRIAAGLRVYTTLAQKEASVNLLAGGPIGPIVPAAGFSPLSMALSFVRATAGKSTYQSRWSPQGASMDQASVMLAYIASWQWSDSGAAIVPNTTQFPSITVGAALASKDLLLNGIAYCVGYCPSSTQGTYYLFADDAWANTQGSVGASTDFFPLRLEAIIAPRLSSGLRPKPIAAFAGIYSLARIVSNPYRAGGAIVQVPFAVANGPFTMQLAVQRWDMAPTLDKSSGELGQSLLCAGGLSAGYDGNRYFELGYPYYPAIVSVTMAGAGGFLSAGVYNYIAQYRWIDAAGQIHLSARSAPFTATALVNDKATVVISQMGFSGRQKAQCDTGMSPQGTWPFPAGQIQILLYRTQAGGGVFNNTLANGAAVLPNSTALTTQSVVDGGVSAQADAGIAGNDLLNGDGSDGTTPGNVLDEECAPASQFVAVHQQRAFFFDGPRVWPTKQFTTFAGLGVNEATAFALEGNATGAASMDDKLIMFTAQAPYWMSGLGPDNAGQNNDWNQPQRIPADSGCIDWRSVVTTPEGVYFQSAAGRRLLTRNLQVVPVTVVEDLDQAQPVVTSALLHPSAGRTVWTQNTDDTTAPRVGLLTFHDYLLSAWSDGVFNDGAGHTQHGFVSACVAGAVTALGPPVTLARTLHLLRADGTVMRESAVSSFDQATIAGSSLFVPLLWQSPWIKADGLQGWSMWMEIRVAFQMLDPAGITVTLAYGGNPAVVDTFSYTAAQVSAMTTAIPQLNLQPTRPQESSIQVTITDSSSGSPVTGAGFRLEGVRIDYGVEPRGGYRTPVSQQG